MLFDGGQCVFHGHLHRAPGFFHLGYGFTHAIGCDAHTQDKRKNMTHGPSFQWPHPMVDLLRYRQQWAKT